MKTVFPFCGSYLRISVFVFFSAGGYEWSTLLGFIFYNIYFIQYFVQKFFTNFFELTVKCIVEIIQKILLTFIFSSYMICWFFFFLFLSRSSIWEWYVCACVVDVCAWWVMDVFFGGLPRSGIQGHQYKTIDATRGWCLSGVWWLQWWCGCNSDFSLAYILD